jgi:hypothetical protein
LTYSSNLQCIWWEIEVPADGLEQHLLDSWMHKSITEPFEYIIDDCHWHNNLPRKAKILLPLDEGRTEQDWIVLDG